MYLQYSLIRRIRRNNIVMYTVRIWKTGPDYTGTKRISVTIVAATVAETASIMRRHGIVIVQDTAMLLISIESPVNVLRDSKTVEQYVHTS